MESINEKFHELYNSVKIDLKPYEAKKTSFSAAEYATFASKQHEVMIKDIKDIHNITKPIILFLVRAIDNDILSRYEAVAKIVPDRQIYLITDTFYPENIVGSLRIIYFFENICHEAGYYYLNTNTMPDRLVTAWDRAIFFLAFYNKDLYNFAWIIEDDVAFTPQSFTQLLEKYDTTTLDFLAARQDVDASWHLWETLHNCDAVPLRLATFNPLVRVSRRFIEGLATVADHHNRLFFLEALFGSFAVSQNLSVGFIEELQGDHFRYRPLIEKYDGQNRIYHPVKDSRVWTDIFWAVSSGLSPL